MVTTDVAKSRVGWMAAGAMLMVLARQGWVVGGGGRCEPHDQALGSVAADRHGAGVRGAGARDVAWPDRAPAAVETTVMPLVTQLQPLARKGADRMVRARDVTQVTNAPTTTLAVKPKPAPIAPARETDPTQACHRPPVSVGSARKPRVLPSIHFISTILHHVSWEVASMLPV
jgi:hypothetical protein